MISVVIPLYNKEKSIAFTLQSVYDQTYTDYEVVIVNDGSTDKSLDAVKEFVERIDDRWIDDRLTIISQANSGVSAARNAGIMAARGEYVTFLDADDLWACDYLEALAALIRDFPNAGLYSMGYSVIREEQIPEGIIKIEHSDEYARGWITEPWKSDLTVLSGSSCGSSRERLIKVGLFDTGITHGEDIDMWWRLILDGGLVRDDRCFAYYRIEAENRAMNRVVPLEKYIPYYVDKYEKARAANAEFRKYCDENMVYWLNPYLLDKKYKKEARKIARKLDYRQMKWSMRFRMCFPKLYKLVQKYK